MKKHILLLMAISLTFISATWGQDPPVIVLPNGVTSPSCAAVTEITATCVASAGALNPIAGTQYTYTVDIPTPPGDKTVHWFVTTDLNFITNGGLTANRELGDGTGAHIAAAGTNYNVETAETSTSNSVNITWKAFTHNPTQPVLLVVYVEGDDCENNNLEAFLIRPVHAFTLDIANLASDGSLPGDAHEICVSPIREATYAILNAATGEGEIQFDFGTNYMFFTVTAANFTDSWMPSFQVSGAGLTGSREITNVEWAYPADATGTTGWNAMTSDGDPTPTFTTTTPVLAQSTSKTVGEEGECIIVRVTIENNQVETIVDHPITLAVDGIMKDLSITTGDAYATASLGDIHHAAGPASECPWIDLFENDKATQILSPRPDINENDPTPFVPTDKE